jgi:hypothetical protein
MTNLCLILLKYFKLLEDTSIRKICVLIWACLLFCNIILYMMSINRPTDQISHFRYNIIVTSFLQNSLLCRPMYVRV